MLYSIKEAYRSVRSFKEWNIYIEFPIPKGKWQTTDSVVCFEELSWYELIMEGRKAAGSTR